MDFTGNMLWLLLLLPALGAAVSLCMPSRRSALAAATCGALPIAAAATWAAVTVFRRGSLLSSGEWLHLDALSAFHLLVMMVVFVLTSLYLIPYFRHEPGEHVFGRGLAVRFAALWHGTMGAMILVLLSNNLGIMWVGVEATTLLTAFLICLRVSKVSLEATWKYLIVCSVGVAFAFMGVLLLAASAGGEAVDSHLLHWTHMRRIAGTLDPGLLKPAFIFLFVGYGTKAGLAPMHVWLPDAHSQAPAPVSAIFSGFMLNMALYCIMRYVALVESASGCAGWAPNLLVVFGLASVMIAAVFILAQHDLKRLLAYHSVEHIGIIAIGLGLGPLGVFAALFHTLNHSVCKTLGFFSAGRIGQIYGTQDMRRIGGSLNANPLWGAGLFGSILALIGVAPFAIFLSELFILKAAAEAGRYAAMAIFLLGTGTVFVGALRHAIDMAWGVKPAAITSGANSVAEWIVVIVPLLLLALLGLWMPAWFIDMLERSAGVLAGS